MEKYLLSLLISVLLILPGLQFKWLYRFISAVRYLKANSYYIEGYYWVSLRAGICVTEKYCQYISLCFGINNHSHSHIHTNTGRCSLVPLRITEWKLIFLLHGNASFLPPRLIGSHSNTEPTQLSIKSNFVSFNCDSKYTSRTKWNLAAVSVLNMSASPPAFLSCVLRISSSYGLWKSLVELSVLWAVPARQQPLL